VGAFVIRLKGKLVGGEERIEKKKYYSPCQKKPFQRERRRYIKKAACRLRWNERKKEKMRIVEQEKKGSLAEVTSEKKRDVGEKKKKGLPVGGGGQCRFWGRKEREKGYLRPMRSSRAVFSHTEVTRGGRGKRKKEFVCRGKGKKDRGHNRFLVLRKMFKKGSLSLQGEKRLANAAGTKSGKKKGGRSLETKEGGKKREA